MSPDRKSYVNLKFENHFIGFMFVYRAIKFLLPLHVEIFGENRSQTEVVGFVIGFSKIIHDIEVKITNFYHDLGISEPKNVLSALNSST